jgi:predicted NBD/HSP70 family sugar kinase
MLAESMKNSNARAAALSLGEGAEAARAAEAAIDALFAAVQRSSIADVAGFEQIAVPMRRAFLSSRTVIEKDLVMIIDEDALRAASEAMDKMIETVDAALGNLERLLAGGFRSEMGALRTALDEYYEIAQQIRVLGLENAETVAAGIFEAEAAPVMAQMVAIIEQNANRNIQAMQAERKRSAPLTRAPRARS